MKFKGKTVLDAAESLTVTVKPGDVKKALSNDPRYCAMAIAGRRQHKLDIEVYHVFVYVDRGAHWDRLMINDEDRKMIRVFDNQRYFRTGTYILTPPIPSLKLGYRKGKSGTSTHPTPRHAPTEKRTRRWASS